MDSANLENLLLLKFPNLQYFPLQNTPTLDSLELPVQPYKIKAFNNWISYNEST